MKPETLVQAPVLSGSEAQVEWAARIRANVRVEFDRVEQTLLRVSEQQPESRREATEAIVAIVRSCRDEVLSRPSAGYFIRIWQEPERTMREMLAANQDIQAIRRMKGSHSASVDVPLL